MNSTNSHRNRIPLISYEISFLWSKEAQRNITPLYPNIWIVIGTSLDKQEHTLESCQDWSGSLISDADASSSCMNRKSETISAFIQVVSSQYSLISIWYLVEAKDNAYKDEASKTKPGCRPRNKNVATILTPTYCSDFSFLSPRKGHCCFVWKEKRALLNYQLSPDCCFAHRTRKFQLRQWSTLQTDFFLYLLISCWRKPLKEDDLRIETGLVVSFKYIFPGISILHGESRIRRRDNSANKGGENANQDLPWLCCRHIYATSPVHEQSRHLGPQHEIPDNVRLWSKWLPESKLVQLPYAILALLHLLPTGQMLWTRV